MLSMTTTSDPGISGFKDIAETLGGGLKENSFMLIEGETRTGKSVLCQHIAYGVLSHRGSPVAYYSSEHHGETLAAQMKSMSLDVDEDLASGQFKVFKIYARSVVREPQKSLKLIVKHIQGLPPQYRLVIIDSPSVYLDKVLPITKVDFLQSCKELCAQERTMVLAFNSHSFERKSLFRAYSMSDYYLRLKNQDVMLDRGQVDKRIIKMIEVTKIAGAERWGGDGMKFEIKPGIGIQIMPFVRVKI
jgi:archaellum biogenesis ATPase FlaH